MITPRIAMPFRSLLALFGFLFAAAAVGHGGGLDSRGCHRDSSAGNYHCHQGPHEGETFASKAAYEDTYGTGSSANDGRYERDEYLSRWGDRDGDCMDTRDEVLAAESLVEPTLSSDGCEVVRGRWRGFYTGRVFTDPGDLDIDHLVPLAEAHESGAADWSNSRKRRYANDLDHPHALIAVEAGANRSKGADDPAEWMPPRTEAHCEYVARWISVKDAWGLDMDSQERRTVNRHQADCGD